MMSVLEVYMYFAAVLLPVVSLYGFVWESRGRLAERKVPLLAARIAEQDALILKLQDALRARA